MMSNLYVGILTVKGDLNKMKQSALDIQQRQPNASVFILSINPKKGHVAVYCHVSQFGLNAGLTANEWLKHVLNACRPGAGGGKPIAASGHFLNISKIEQAKQFAFDFANPVLN